MDSMVEENGNVDPLAPSPVPDPPMPIVSSVQSSSHHLVQVTLPTHTHAQVGAWAPPCARLK